MNTLLALTTFLAAAGGGGSSSGGSGGGGGGELFALIGYLPSYYLGKLVKKLLPRTAELVVSATAAVIFSIVLFALGIQGGFFGGYITILVIIGIWAGWGAAFFGLWDKLKKRSQAAKTTIATAAQTDSSWNETALQQHATQTFLRYQQDWSTFNIASMQQYLAPHYARHATLLLAILKELGRTNVMANVAITQSLIVDAHDDANDANDSYTVAFEAKANDQLIDAQGRLLFENKKPFTEYWRFIRSNDNWLLDSITPQTQELSMTNASLQAFATTNNMFYSLDMGWLFLPANGILMQRGKFGVADINNHVVGTYHERLVQLYTYTPVPNGTQGSPSWLVLQITLPKSYGGIITQPAKKAFSSTSLYQKPPKNFTRYTFEWQDFNKRYTVHATDADRLAAFELINPGFMAYLYDNDPYVSIEVADNVLYLYRYLGARTTTTVNAQEYHTMLTIALKAFKELQL